jgi:hypothetical protein
MGKKRQRSRHRAKQAPAVPWLMRNLDDLDRARREHALVFVGESMLSTPEQDRRCIDWRAGIAAIERSFPDVKRDLLEAIASYDPFDLLAAVQIAALQRMPSAGDPALAGVLAVPELMALLLVEGAVKSGERTDGQPDLLEALDRFLAATETWLMAMPDALVPYPAPHETDREAVFARIRHAMLQQHLLGPGNATDVQVDACTRAVLMDRDVSVHLQTELGMDASTAVHLVEVIGTLVANKLRERIEAGDHSLHGKGAAITFTIGELAEAATIDSHAVERFVARFGLDIDGTPFSFRELTTRARHRPLLRADGRVGPIAVQVLRRSLRSSLGALLNPAIPSAGPGARATFNAYSDARGAWLEQKGAEALQDGLQMDWTELNIYYRLPDRTEGEIDVLARLDNTLFVIQAKSGATRIDSEAADPGKLRKTLQGLLGGGDLRQHRDGLRAVMQYPSELTRDRAGRVPFTRTLSGINRVLALNVTLEDLSALGAQPWLIDQDGLSSDREPPWIVGLGELEQLLDLFRSPSLFVHFLTRRLRANATGQLIAHDEIDWAVRYFDDELLFAELPVDHPYAQGQFLAPDEHKAYDAWMVARALGGRARRPRPNMPTGQKRLLGMLESSRPAGWLDFSIALLDLPRPQRTQVLKCWQRHMSGRVPGSVPLDVAFGDDGKVVRGFSVLREPKTRRSDGKRILTGYCEDLCRRHDARQWAGIVAPFQPAGPIRWTCVVRRWQG